jgi:hypothetical protein
MKRITNYLTGALALGLCLWGARQTNAQTYTYTPNYGSPDELTGGFAMSVSTTGSGTISDSGALVGGILMTATGIGVDGNNGSSFTTVCTDLGGTLYLGDSYAFKEVSFNGQTGLNPAWGNNGTGGSSSAAAYQAINNAAYLYSTYDKASMSTTDWAALQLAVWKALYDTEANGNIAGITDIDTSRFNVQTDPTGAAWTEAQSWLKALPSSTPQYAGYLLYPSPASQYGAVAQEVLVNVSPVPEPTTLAAGAILLVPFAMSSLRFLPRRSVA